MSSSKKRRAKFRADTIANQSALELHATKTELQLYTLANAALLTEVLAWRKAYPEKTFAPSVDSILDIPKDSESELLLAKNFTLRESFFYDKPPVPALHLSRWEIQRIVDLHHQMAFRAQVDSQDYLFHKTRAEFFRALIE